MRYFFAVLLFFVCPFCFCADWVLEYKSVPEKADCSFIFDIKILSKKTDYKNNKKINISLKKEKEKKFTGVIENTNRKSCEFLIENKGLSLKAENPAGITIYPGADVSHNIITSQLFLPDKPVNVGDSWGSEITNPLSQRKLCITNRLMRVADNIASIVFTVRSPYSGSHISDMDGLMEQKLKDGSTFLLELDKRKGHAEIIGSGIWFFDVRKGTLAGSEQFFRFTSLVSDKDLSSAIGFDDLAYLDVNAHFIYDFKEENE